MGHEIRTGDVVIHAPSGEEWLVAFSEHGNLCPCGWPQSFAKTSDCHLIRKGSDKERHNLLIQMSEIDGYDPRKNYANRILEK